tara:strand:- start:3649 stop:4407 length:759 start_codon:yes stop_codon:yes gene_type:complete
VYFLLRSIKSIIKIFIFFLRVILFLFSYFLYCLNIIFIFLNFKKFSKKVFVYAAYFCSISLGIKYNVDSQSKVKLLYDGIHIANHENPFDIFVAQYIFRIPTITTVQNHLSKILPFFELTLKNYGHFTFNHLILNERKFAYLFLKEFCFFNKRILIFPSGSIYTSIDKRFSKSVSKLSISNNLKVIAWKFSYLEKSKKNVQYKKNVVNFILERFFSDEIDFNIEKVKVFNPTSFSSQQEYHEALFSFYRNLS